MNSIRQTTAETIYTLAKKDRQVIALTADLSSSVGFDPIKNELPKQFIECGIAEQEMMSLAAGLSLSGKKPFAASYTQFHPGRNWDQLRTSVCYNKTPVRLISSHYGLSVGGDGATHQNLEYLSLTLCLPNLKVYLPFNNESAKWCIQKMYENNDIGSILFQPRDKQIEQIEEISIKELEEFGFVYDCTNSPKTNLIITGGLISSEAYSLKENSSVDYVFLVELTRLDTKKLSQIIANYQHITIVEEHQRHGGLGSIIFEINSTYGLGKKINHVCIDTAFGKSGLKTAELWKKFGIDSGSIINALS
jgi:transketolase